MAPDVGLYFFGDYPRQTTAADAYDALMAAVRHADRQGYSSVWLPERHFHSFGGIFPNPSVLAAAIAQTTTRVRINSGSVVLPLHDPIRVAEEWSVVDNLSRGRVGLGCASGWSSDDFVFFPDRFGTHRDLMYQHIDEVRRLWRGEAVTRTGGDGEPTQVAIHPRPIQPTPPMYAAVVGRRESYAMAARNDLGIVTNLMTQDVTQLADNIAYYRKVREEHGLDPKAGRVSVLMHTYLAADADRARREAYRPLTSYLRSSLGLFGQVTNSLGFNVNLSSATEDDLAYLFERAYQRYCDARALIGSPESCQSIVDALYDAGVDEIAALVDFGMPAESMLAGLEQLDELRRRTVRPDAPLSPGQHRMWLADQLAPGNVSQNEPKAFRIRGPLDVAALRAAANDLVVRHEALRTVYRAQDGVPGQVVLPTVEAEFSVEDRAGTPEQQAVADLIGEESRRRFDLAEGPLFLMRLVRLADDHHILVLTMHHIAIDAVSARTLTRDLSELYDAHVQHRRPRLRALATGPRHVAHRQLAAAESAKARADLAYWTEVFSGDVPTLRLPTDRPRPAVQTFEGRAHFSTIDATITQALRELSSQSGATLFMTLLAGIAATLRRFTGDDDLVIGVPVSDRPEGTEDLVGFYVNTLPLRLDTSGDPSFTDLLRRVRGVALDAYDHASVPFESVVRAVNPPRDTSRTPLFCVMAEYKHTEAFELELTGADVVPLHAGRDVSVTDLAFHLVNQGDQIVIHTEYHTGLFDDATIERLVEYVRATLRRATTHPDRPISALTAVSEPDRDQLHRWGTGPDTRDEPATIPQLIADQAARNPDAVAVTDGDTVLRYVELDTAATRRAAWLATAGVAPGDVVAVWLPRTVDNVVTLLAIQKAGAAYLPLDPALGEARVREVLADSRSRLVIVDGVAPPLPEGVTALRLDPEAEQDLDTQPTQGPNPDDICYVIYTSGSTGRPKGVAVPHRAVVNLCRWFGRRFTVGAGDRSALVCGQSFDASVLETWPALTCGASLAIAPESVRLDPVDLAAWFATYDVTFSLLPTALGEAVMALPDAQQPPLKVLMIGGDVLRRRPPSSAPYETVNAYGPTEATVLVTTQPVTADDDGPIGIGTPIDNTTLLVLDEHRRPVPPGVVGELYVGGRCLAEGYLHAPELTRQRFVDDDAYGRLYRTGDLVRWHPRGFLQFHGRVDDQVKVRGFRVEPGEATRALRELPGIADGLIIARRDDDERAYLAGYLVGSANAPSDLAAYAERELLKRLPEYLVPRTWAVLDGLPKDANGKVDRRALPPTAPAGGTTGEPPGSPATSDAQPRPTATAREATNRTPAEQLRALWAEVLGVSQDRITDQTSFFEWGGHSIAAMKLLSRARERLGLTQSTLEFYTDPRFGTMAAALQTDEVIDEELVSYQQHHMVSAASTRPAASWNITLHIDLTGELDVAALRTALNAVTERHQALRTRFVERDGRWWQQVLPHRPVELPVLDMRSASKAVGGAVGEATSDATTEATVDPVETAAHAAAAEVSEAPMNLAEGRPFRARLLRLRNNHWRLVLVIHHAVCDGWSAAIVLRDLAEGYRSAASGAPVALPPATQSIDYARWQRSQENLQTPERIDYWRKRLADATFRVDLPADRPAPARPSKPAVFVRRPLPNKLAAAIDELARQRGSTPFAVWAAALGVLVAERTGVASMVLGTPHAAREHPDHDTVVSSLARVSLLPVDVVPDSSFGDLVAQTMQEYAAGLDHFVPLVPLLAALAEDRGDEVPTVMPVSLTYQSSADVDLDLPGLDVAVRDVPHRGPRGRTTVFVEPRRTGTTYGVLCDGDRYEEATVISWLDRLVEILRQGTHTPDAPLSDLADLTSTR